MSIQSALASPFSRLAFAACLLVGLFLPLEVLGQTDQTGALRVTVTDESGGVLPGVIVEASRQDGSNLRTSVTNAKGLAVLAGLVPGAYDVTAELEGFDPASRTGVPVNAGRATPVELRLGLGAVAEQVTVVASAPLIDVSTTEQSTILGEEITEVMPISRTATDLVKFTPGGSNNALWGGSTDQANAYKLDGVSVNQPGFGGSFLLPNVDWIQEFQVKGLGAGAEYGGFQGGVVNIVTKSGGNDVKGSLRFNLEDQSLNSSNVNLEEAGSENDRRLEFNANLSGPAVRDSLFYFLSAQRAEFDTRIVDDEASTNDIVFLDTLEERAETKILAKLNWQAKNDGLLSALIGWDEVETENRGLDSFTSPAAATTQDSPTVFYNLSWTDAVGTNTFYELKLSGYEGDDDRLPKNGDTPAVRILGGDRETFRNAVFTRLRSPESTALSAGFDAYLDSGRVQHQLKFGLEYEDGAWLERRIRSGGFTWRPEEGSGLFDPNDPSTWGFISSDWGSGIGLDAETVNAAAYAQDYIDLTSWLRLSAGIRWSRWEGTLNPGFGSGPAIDAIDDEAFDPRIGLVADLSRDGTWIGKIHWGRYHQNLFALMFDRVAGGNVFQDEEYWDWIGPGLPDVDRNYSLEEREQFFELFPPVVATGSEVGPVLDYEQPFVDQLVASVEWNFRPNWKAGLTYVNRENDNIVALVDRNLASNYTLFRNVSVIDFRSGDPILDTDGNPLTLAEILVSNRDILDRGWAPGLTDEQVAALSFDQDLVLTNPDDAEREMDQVQLVFEGRGQSYDVSLSAVFTDLVGNFYSISGYSDPGGTGAGSYVEPNEGLNDRGELQNVSEWELKLRYSVELPWDLRAGVYALYVSGDAFTPTYTIDNRNHDFIADNGEFFSFRHFGDVNGEAIFLEPRGSREYDSYTQIDVHLDKAFELGRTNLVVGFDVFNLTNEDAVRSLVTSVNEQDPSDPSTLFGAPLGRLAPRTTRLYASLRW